MKIPEFEVSFGKKKKHPLHLYILGAVLGFIIDMLHRLLHVSPKDLWALVDQIGREFDIEDIQQLVLASPTLLNDRIRRDVDDAIKDVKPEDPEIKSVFTEEKEGETPLGGELRIRGEWVPENEEDQ